MAQNYNVGYGRANMDAVTAIAGITPVSKIFIVGSSSVARREVLDQIYKTDNDGLVRNYTTLSAASSAATANAGDVILVLPLHTETISSSTALTLSKAGVTIVGLGSGNNRPTITLDTATSATINVTAANITIKNIIFVANFAAIVSCFTTTTAKDFALLGCEFRDTTAILNFVNIVDTNATTNDTDGLRIEDCKRIGLGATSATTIVKMDGTNDRLSIKRNYFTHAAVTAAGLMPIATGKVVTNAEIDSNIFNLTGATGATTGILITTDGTTNSGYLVRNFIQSLDATTEILVTASSGFVFSQNFYSGVADKSGYLLPSADA